jgi:hypothetical protein
MALGDQRNVTVTNRKYVRLFIFGSLSAWLRERNNYIVSSAIATYSYPE